METSEALYTSLKRFGSFLWVRFTKKSNISQTTTLIIFCFRGLCEQERCLTQQTYIHTSVQIHPCTLANFLFYSHALLLSLIQNGSNTIPYAKIKLSIEYGHKSGVFSLLKIFTNSIKSCHLTFKVTYSELYKYAYPDVSIFGLGLRFIKTKNLDQNWKIIHYYVVMFLSFAFFFLVGYHDVPFN